MGNAALNPTQTNTAKVGITAEAAADLSGKEGLLAVLSSDTGTVTVDLPAARSDLALYIIDEGGAEGETVSLSALNAGENFRVRLNGTITAGSRVVLDDVSGANKGKVCSVPATEGVYFSPGIAEEDGVDEQLVLVRPCPQLVFKGTAFSAATPAATAATNTSPYGFSEAQANAILTNVREMRAFLVAMGFKATS